MTKHEAFSQRYGSVVRRLVARAGRGLPRHMREDLQQAAQLGIARGVASYDAASGRVFALFVLDCVRTELNAVSRPERRRAAAEESLEALLEAAGEGEGEAVDQVDPTPPADEQLHQHECQEQLRSLIDGLEDIDDFALAVRRFTPDEPYTLEQLAALHPAGTVAAVREHEKRVRVKLRRAYHQRHRG